MQKLTELLHSSNIPLCSKSKRNNRVSRNTSLESSTNRITLNVGRRLRGAGIVSRTQLLFAGHCPSRAFGRRLINLSSEFHYSKAESIFRPAERGRSVILEATSRSKDPFHGRFRVYLPTPPMLLNRRNLCRFAEPSTADFAPSSKRSCFREMDIGAIRYTLMIPIENI